MVWLGLGSYILVGSFLVWTVWRRPAMCVGAYFCMFGLDHWSSSQIALFYHNSWITNMFVAAILVAAALVQVARRHSIRYPINRSQVLIVGLLVYAAVSTVWSPYEQAVEIWTTRWVYLCLGVLVLPLLFREERDFDNARNGTIIIGVVLSVCLVMFGEWRNRALVVRHASAGTLLSDPLNIAVMGGFLLLAAIFAGKSSFGLWMIVRWTAVVASVGLVILSGSRGQFAFMVAVALILLPISHYMRNLWGYFRIAFAMCLFGAVSFVFYDQYVAKDARWQLDQLLDDWNGRWEMVSRLVEAWWSQPSSLLFGLGNAAAYDPRIVGFYPHVVPLEVLCEEGMVGFSVYLLLLSRVIKNADSAFGLIKTRRDLRASCATYLGFVLFTFLLSLKQGSLVGSHFFLSSVVLFERFTLVVASGGRQSRERRGPVAKLGDKLAPSAFPAA